MHSADRTLNSVRKNLDRIRNAATGFGNIGYRPSQLVDSWMLWAHYRATVGLFFLVFVTITSDWYAEYPMECVNMFDRSEVWDYFKDLCLSYSYTNATRGSDSNEDDRVYAAHYRWIHWVALFLMLVYYLPLLAARSCQIPHVQNLLKDITVSEDQKREQKLQAALLLVEELGWNAFVYTSHIMSHIIALTVNITGILIVDTLLQNNFLMLVISQYPFVRDSQHFSDPLSLLFPPFVTCKVGPEMMLLNYRTEVIGCHLTLMELYEKFFIGLWFWLLFLLVGTLCKIISLFFLSCSKAHKLQLISLCVEAQHGDSLLVVSRYSLGDLLVLSKLKEVLDGKLYCKVLHHAAYIEWPDQFDEENIPEQEPIVTCY